MEEFQTIACICGYHIFKDVWEAALSKELMCDREPQPTRLLCCSCEEWNFGSCHWIFTEKNSKSVFTVFAKRRYSSLYSNRKKTILRGFALGRAWTSLSSAFLGRTKRNSEVKEVLEELTAFFLTRHWRLVRINSSVYYIIVIINSIQLLCQDFKCFV